MAKCEVHQNDVYIITSIDGFYDIRIEPGPEGRGWLATPRRNPPGVGAGSIESGLTKKAAASALVREASKRSNLSGVSTWSQIETEVLNAIDEGCSD